MPGFPLMWESHRLGPPSEDGCPVRASVIATYLESCAYDYLLDDEPPPTFGPLSALVLRKDVSGHRFWMWSCSDSLNRPWLVLAGESPSDPKRWLLAESNEDGRSPEEFLATTLEEMGVNRAN